MKLLSVNVGQPAPLIHGGRTLRSAIVKRPVEGRVGVGRLGLVGDAQADLRVHGGVDKAVYAYPSEHASFWAGELDIAPPGPGDFGENLTTAGLLETEVRIGDRFRIGGVELVVTEPRQPCLKLQARFGRDDMRSRFADSGRTGFYLSVAREGELGAGDAIERLSSDPASLTVAEIVRAWHSRDATLLGRAADLVHLPAGWRRAIRTLLGELKG